MRIILLGIPAIVQLGCNNQGRSLERKHNQHGTTQTQAGTALSPENILLSPKKSHGAHTPVVVSPEKAIGAHTRVVGGQPIKELTDLDPAIKVLAHFQGDTEQVVLVRPDGTLFAMQRHGDVLVDDKVEPELVAALPIYADELKAGVLVPQPLDHHPILKFFEDSSDVEFENKRFKEVEQALADPVVGALVGPVLRTEALRGTEEWKSKGLVVFHLSEGGDADRIAMISSDFSQLFGLERDEDGELTLAEQGPGDAHILKHFEIELRRGNIELEALGRNHIIMKIGKKGFSVLGTTGARFVPTASVLADPFLGPRIGFDRRMKCHTVPSVDESLPGSLEDDFSLVVHYILNNDIDAQFVIAKKKSDGSIWVLSSSEDEGARGLLTVEYSPDSEDADTKAFREAGRKLAESSDFVEESWGDHTVYEWMELENSFAIHSLERPGATIVGKSSAVPAIALMATVMAEAETFSTI